MDELALVHGQVQPVVLGHVDPDPDRHVILAADHVFEIQLVLVDMPCVVDLLLAAQPVEPDVERTPVASLANVQTRFSSASTASLSSLSGVEKSRSSENRVPGR